MHNFKELRIWKDAMQLSRIIYSATKNFPKEEKYGLGQQINRAAISIPSNIAEGAGRGTRKDFRNFINIAIGSSFELETQAILANDFGFINEKTFLDINSKIDVLQKMLYKFRNTLN